MRRAWLREHLRSDEPGEDWDEPETPWREATAPGIHPVFWVCLSHAGEHASFLKFAAGMAGRPFDVVDATGASRPGSGGSRPIWPLGQLSPAAIVASGLGAGRRTVSDAESDAARATWTRLRQENAPLRVVRDARLVSAPLTQFDAILTGQAGQDWGLLVALIGRALGDLDHADDPPGQGCSYEFLFARVLALGEAGALDVRGTGPGMRDYAVRRPGAPSEEGPRRRDRASGP